jgi:flagellar hook assembly protein FlgD
LAFKLDQNFPNPFNPTTTISFTLDAPAYTYIAIYNLLGQRVNTVLSEYLGAGEHRVIWNGRNQSGQPVSSGIYFYMLQSGENFDAKKMAVLR